MRKKSATPKLPKKLGGRMAIIDRVSTLELTGKAGAPIRAPTASGAAQKM
jgi:hypothetical protein